jgi:hypothetical protein
MRLPGPYLYVCPLAQGTRELGAYCNVTTLQKGLAHAPGDHYVFESAF